MTTSTFIPKMYAAVPPLALLPGPAQASLISTRQFMDNKGFCEDITEGKFSFPIIHAIRAMPHDHRILSILKQRTNGKLYLVLCERSTIDTAVGC